MLARIGVLVLAVGLLLGGRPVDLRAQDFKVIVNAANPASSMSQEEVAQAFMKRKARWGDGTEIAPVDLAGESGVRDTFSNAIHGRGASAVRAFWQQQIFSGRGVPPVEVKSDREVLDFVAGNPGAIGYVSAGANLGPDCKVLEVQVN